MKVGIVSTHAPERCGLRVYTEELMYSATENNRDIDFDIIGRPFDSSVVDRAQGFDIVHVMHVGNLFGAFSTDQVLALKSRGIKTVCTWHESSETGNRNPYTEAFDRVVVHELTNDGFDIIYHGVPEVIMPIRRELHLYDYVGTSGFPLPFKNYPLAARLAAAVGKKLYAFLPESNHGDVHAVEAEIQNYCPGSIVAKQFAPHAEIVRTLSHCAFTLFPYSHTNTGIGGSMRVGIGAMRPVIISDVIRFRDVLSNPGFSSEFYVIPSANPTFENSIETVMQCAKDVARCEARIPVKTLSAMSWSRSASHYVEIYRGLMREK